MIDWFSLFTHSSPPSAFSLLVLADINYPSASLLARIDFVQTSTFAAAHEGSARLSRDIPAGAVQPTGPGCFLPGAWDQRHAPELLLRPEGPAGWARSGGGRRDELHRLWSDGGRPVSENGKLYVLGRSSTLSRRFPSVVIWLWSQIPL